MDSNTKIVVFVQLMNEGTQVYRPAPAVYLDSETAKLLEHESYDPDDEDWEFKPGSIVKVAMKDLSKGPTAIAVELIEGERSIYTE